jgi:hypothetical protein
MSSSSHAKYVSKYELKCFPNDFVLFFHSIVTNLEIPVKTHSRTTYLYCLHDLHVSVACHIRRGLCWHFLFWPLQSVLCLLHCPTHALRTHCTSSLLCVFMGFCLPTSKGITIWRYLCRKWRGSLLLSGIIINQ